MKYTDTGLAIAQALLDGMLDSIEFVGGDAPSWSAVIAGAAVPTSDACDGQLWTRVQQMVPTVGDGQPLGWARWGSDITAWAYIIELGWLACHPVIDEDGAGPDDATASAYAERDGLYRAAIARTVMTLPDRVSGSLKQSLMSQIVGPWAPIGPDGGYSGGLVTITYVAGTPAVC